MSEAHAHPREETAAVPTIDVVATLERVEASGGALIVDLRSPAEFAEDHLPGAHSVPLFDDAERAMVGLLYRRDSPQAAFELGLDVVLEKVGALVGRIAQLAAWPAGPDAARQRVLELVQGGIGGLEERLALRPWTGDVGRPVVLHCWRGGLRSRSVVALLRRLGFDEALVLEGGYRAYRNLVRRTLEIWSAPPTFVLRGLTGVGKTLVLRKLERLRPRWTLDLEAAAGHRSSLLGMVGLEPCSQKAFESRLVTRLGAGFPGPLVLEGESRRVGDAIVPRRIWEPLANGTNVLLVADTERRIDVLIEDYLASESNRAHLGRQLALVEARMERRFGLSEMLDAGRERELVALLLEHYYDPLYRHSEKGREYAVTIDAGNPPRAAAEVAEWIEARS